MKFIANRLHERLWVKPLIMCIISIGMALIAKAADGNQWIISISFISSNTVESLLKIIASSMLVMATFAVGSMISAYSSASRTATPRSFPLIISDDISQNALSYFIGAFIFSIVSLIALLSDFYGEGGIFALFLLTLVVFTVVISTFVRWVDKIARLGHLKSTVDKVECAATNAFKERMRNPLLGGVPLGKNPDSRGGIAVKSKDIGYLQRVDTKDLQTFAKEHNLRIVVSALPGSFIGPERIIAYIVDISDTEEELDLTIIEKAFHISDGRTFDEDPRFGLVVLSEIAVKALSPGINDPGTAITVLGSYIRLFHLWSRAEEFRSDDPTIFDRIEVPEIELKDLFDDAFAAISRDGAATLEVGVRLQKALTSLSSLELEGIHLLAKHHSNLAIKKANNSSMLEEELEVLKASSPVNP
ncbi:DUF2254 domain-containing protein [Akkermansiaceae bacterium]|nr:DUF2254 domain-containing protein [Akkermansiaceae bacterium]